MKGVIWIGAVIVIAGIAGVARGIQKCGDITVAPLSFQIRGATHGSIEHRFRLANQSKEATHEVTIWMPEKGRRGITRLSRTTVLAPGSEAIISLIQPGINIYGSGQAVMLVIDGMQQEYRVGAASGESEYSYSGGMRNGGVVLVSRSVNRDTLETTTKVVDRNERVFIKPDAGVESWSDSWIAYTPFDGILLAEEDIRTMPAGVGRALWAYVECGGVLAVLGNGAALEKYAPEDIQTEYRTTHCGFGVYAKQLNRSENQLDQHTLRLLITEWQRSGAPWRKDAFFNAQHFPVIETLAIPVRGTLFLMMVFAVIVGPVNMYVVSKLKRRIWLLWTVPAISIMFCGAMFINSLFSEGITPRIKMESITLLDQTARQAISLGIVGIYCPLTPGEGLHFPFSYEITPIISRSSYQETAKTIDNTVDQHLQIGWIAARWPSYFYLRVNEPRRERIEFRRSEEGEIVAINGLGAAVTRLTVVDDKGDIYTGEHLAAGERSVLKASGRKIKGARPETLLRGMFFSEGATWQIKESMNNRPEELLGPGTYYAELESAPFIEPGIAGRTKTESRSVVLGSRIEIENIRE